MSERVTTHEHMMDASRLSMNKSWLPADVYEKATVSRLLKITGLFSRISSLL